MDLCDCESLKSLPPRIHSTSLKDLFLSGCTNLMRLPDISSCNIEVLDLDGLAIEELPSSIGCLSRLFKLNISKCSKLKNIPSSIGFVHNLTALQLSDCCMTELPESLGELSSLKKFCISDCSNLQRLPSALGNLKALQKLEVERVAIEKVPSSIGFLHNLEILNLHSCCITELPESLGQLSSLDELKLSYCERLQYLPKLPGSLNWIWADNCKSLKEVPSDLSIFLEDRSKRFEILHVHLKNCFELDQNKLSQTVKKFLQNIQIIETKRWEEAEIAEREEFHFRSLEGEIYYPGSEIPEWFEFQGMGSSGTLKLPQGWRSNKVLGVVICVIGTLGRNKYSESEDSWCKLECSCKLTCKQFRSLFCQSFERLIYWTAGTPHYVDSDHVILSYLLGYNIFLKDFDERVICNKAFIRFNGYHKLPENLYMNVRKWGIHFSYRLDRSSDEEELYGSGVLSANLWRI